MTRIDFDAERASLAAEPLEFILFERQWHSPPLMTLAEKRALTRRLSEAQTSNDADDAMDAVLDMIGGFVIPAEREDFMALMEEKGDEGLAIRVMERLIEAQTGRPYAAAQWIEGAIWANFAEFDGYCAARGVDPVALPLYRVFNLWWYAVTEHADERERDRIRMEVEGHVLRLEVRTSPVAPEEFVPSWWKGDDEAAMSTRAATMILGGNRRSQEGLVSRT